MQQFLELINDEKNLNPHLLELLILPAVAVAYAARCIESIDLQFEHLEFHVDNDGNEFVVVKFLRHKNKKDKKWSEVIIRGALQIKIIKRYIACFPQDKRTGRFYRALMWKNGEIVATQNVRGRNHFGDYGQQIAETIGKVLDLGEKITGSKYT